MRQMGLSKRGDTYLRTLLMHGARSVIIQGKRTDWVDGLLKRRPFNVAVAAVANKLASTIWAVLARPEKYQASPTARALDATIQNIHNFFNKRKQVLHDG